jgi:hypothetical protein
MKLEPKFRHAPAGAPISATQPAVHNEMAFGQNRQQRMVAQAAWPPWIVAFGGSLLMLSATLEYRRIQIQTVVSFRKLSVNDRALFANDPEDKHPNLNKHKGRATLIVIHS